MWALCWQETKIEKRLHSHSHNQEPEVLKKKRGAIQRGELSKITMNTKLLGASDNTNLACDVAVSFLDNAILSFKDRDEYTKELGTMLFPLI